MTTFLADAATNAVFGAAVALSETPAPESNRSTLQSVTKCVTTKCETTSELGKR
jgi:hypothetical protein